MAGIRIIKTPRAKNHRFLAIYKGEGETISARGNTPEEARDRLHQEMAKEVVKYLREKQILNPAPSKAKRAAKIQKLRELAYKLYGDFERQGDYAKSRHYENQYGRLSEMYYAILRGEKFVPRHMKEKLRILKAKKRAANERASAKRTAKRRHEKLVRQAKNWGY